MSDLIEDFLRARLDEDEQIALRTKDCSCGRCDYSLSWQLREDGLVTEIGLDVGHTQAPGYITEEQAAYIVLNDPARAVREVAAKRKLIEDVASEATGLDMSVDLDRRVGGRDETEEPYLGDVLLRVLAQVYSDHPDWREEWAA